MHNQFFRWFTLTMLGLSIITACSSGAAPTLGVEPKTPAVLMTRESPSTGALDATKTPSPANLAASVQTPTHTPSLQTPVVLDQPLCETRGVWLNAVAFRDAAKRQQTLANISKSNLNTVFLISYPLNGNWGPADKKSFDAAYNHLIQQGVSVHVFLDSFRRMEGDELAINYAQLSEWDAQARWGLDFLNAYPDLSGVFYDNLRYPSRGNSVTERQRQDLTNTVKTIHQKIKAAYPNKLLSFYGSQVDPKPLNSKMVLPQWFESWIESHPDNPYYIQGQQYRADNLKYDQISWILNGYMDAFMPGDYTTSVELWNKRIALWKNLFDGDRKKYLDRIYFGLGWLREHGEIVYPDGTTYPGGGTDPAAAVSQIKASRQQGMKGVVIFQYGKLANDSPLVNALSTDEPSNDYDAPFKKPAASCLK